MRRSLAVVVALVVPLWAAATPAAAAPIPAGDYAVKLTGGSLAPGGLVPTLGVTPTDLANVTVGAAPVSISIPPETISVPPATGTLVPGTTYTITPTVNGPVTASLDPATGTATGNASLSVRIQTAGLLTADCTLGPADLPLSTDPPGAPFDAATGALALGQSGAGLPTAGCSSSTIAGLLSTIVGTTTTTVLNLLLQRLPDPPLPDGRGGTGGGTAGGTGTGGTGTGTSGGTGTTGTGTGTGSIGGGTGAIGGTVLRIVRGTLRLRARATRVKLSCVSAPSRCTGRLVLLRGRRTLGSKRFSILPGRSAIVRLALSRRSRRLVPRRRGLRVTAVATLQGVQRPVSRRLLLKR